VGGQATIQAGQYVTFIVSAWIREMGFRGTMKIDVPRAEREHLAVAAGLGKLNGDGKLTVPKYGTKIHIADIIFTDLPMEADG
jgi:epoxyqueuosine reductase QueG